MEADVFRICTVTQLQPLIIPPQGTEATGACKVRYGCDPPQKSFVIEQQRDHPEECFCRYWQSGLTFTIENVIPLGFYHLYELKCLLQLTFKLWQN